MRPLSIFNTIAVPVVIALIVTVVVLADDGQLSPQVSDPADDLFRDPGFATATPTPTPTLMPEPSPTPEPEPDGQVGEDGTIALEGTGTVMSTVLRLSGGVAVFRISHTGSGAFVVELRNGEGTTRVLVDTIGAFDGSAAVVVEESGTYYLDVTADGDWEVVVPPHGNE